MPPLTSSERVARASQRASRLPSGALTLPVNEAEAGAAQNVYNVGKNLPQPTPNPQQTSQLERRDSQVIQNQPALHAPAQLQRAPTQLQRAPTQLQRAPTQLQPVAEPGHIQPYNGGQAGGYQQPQAVQQNHVGPTSNPAYILPPKDESNSLSPSPNSASSRSFHSPQGTPVLPVKVSPPPPTESPPVPPGPRQVSQTPEPSPPVTPAPQPLPAPKPVPVSRRSSYVGRNEQLAGTELYPGFDRDGDVLIQCNLNGERMGFLVNSFPLRRVSETFANAISPQAQGGKIAVTVTESSYQMSLLLHSIVYGTTHPAFNSLTVNDYIDLLGLYDKYAIVPVLRKMLVHNINNRSSDLARPLTNTATSRSDIESYLHLAHVCQSNKLWAAALQFANRWQELVRPWNCTASTLDPEIFDILLALEGVKGPGEGYAALKVVYSDDKPVAVGRIKGNVLFSVSL